MSNVLSQIHSPVDVKKLNNDELKQLCDELRQTIISTVAENGGHLASNLGAVELTVALHKVFDCPNDSFVWDVGHQCYSHKLLTGRYDNFSTLRKKDGITGFPNPMESQYDSFIAGHSSTSVSIACGLAKANTLEQNGNTVVAICGDGAMTGGLTFEGLSNAGINKDRLIVILNDNHMSINKNVGFVAKHLANLRSQSGYVKFKSGLANLLNHLPVIGKPIYRFLLRQKQLIKYSMYNNSSMFEEMGFYYFGPIDGHNIKELVKVLETAKKIEQPVLVHVETVKGKGYGPAVNNPDVFHGISKFDIETGKTPTSSASFSSVFGDTIADLAEQDDKIIAITAAMKSGTGFQKFADLYPKRFFDVGIAEEHAITFASALASKGQIPVVALYSTFLQRTFDQLLNDTAIMQNHIVIGIDRSGIVPDDGVTHQGIFDVPMLNAIPGFTIFSPSTFEELRICLKEAIYNCDGPVVVRYPKGNELPGNDSYTRNNIDFGYLEANSDTIIVSYGRISCSVNSVVQKLKTENKLVSALSILRIRPISKDVIDILQNYKHIVFFEEGSLHGGVAESIGSKLLQNGYKGDYHIHAIDGFIDTCKTSEGLHDYHLDEEGIYNTIIQLGEES